MVRRMRTVSDIFDQFGGPASVARLLGVNASTASEMKRRSSIPVRHWPALTAEAKERGIPLTNDDLVDAHAATAGPERVPA